MGWDVIFSLHALRGCPAGGHVVDVVLGKEGVPGDRSGKSEREERQVVGGECSMHI